MKLVFASSNPNKIKEIQSLMPRHIEILGLTDIGCYDEIPETADTIEGNAILKADYVAKNFGLDCFADDSGLETSALNGRPGVFSARYAGLPKNDDRNIDQLLADLKSKKNRNANFKTVICLNLNGRQYLFTGIIDGVITTEKKGRNGFGYDPVFIPNGHQKTFAEMTMEEKSAISHRGIAVHKLIGFLETASGL